MPFGKWTPAIPSEYGGVTAPMREYIEPARPDPKADRVGLAALLTETGWSVDDLEYAIGAYQHPKPLGRTLGKGWNVGETVYSRDQIRRWRDRLVGDLERLGFTVKPTK